MSKLLEVKIYTGEFEGTEYYEEYSTENLQSWCDIYLEKGMYMFNGCEEIFIFEQDLSAIPTELQEIASIQVFKNDGPVENYE